MLASLSLDIYSVTTTIINLNKLSISIWISGSELKNVETLGLIDSGAGGKFIDQNYARAAGFKLCKLETPLRAYNVDGTENKWGTIKTYVNHQENVKLHKFYLIVLNLLNSKLREKK